MILVIRSIHLSKETRNAWNSAGCHVVKRSHYDRPLEGDAVINLGNLDNKFSDLKLPVFNRPDTIRAISSPRALRRTLNDFIPEQSVIGPHWHKFGGYGGVGKRYHDDTCTMPVVGYDVQQHVDGIEYRVTTVGDTVVQAHKKELLDGVGNFVWHWVGVDGVRANGIIPLCKKALGNVPGGDYSMFGWDIIVGKDGPIVIEINTSPGVNEHTAQRIVTQIERMI